MELRNISVKHPTYKRAALALGVLLSCCLTAASATQPTSGISFAQVISNESALVYGLVSVAPGALYGSGYINVELYEDGEAVDWAVRNLAYGEAAGQSGATARFDLRDAGRQYAFTAYVDFSPAPLPDDASLKGRVPLVYLLSRVEAPADDNPNQFEDVVCHRDDAKFWAGQQSVVSVLVRLGRFSFGEGTGWIVKGRDPNKKLLITASHNFTDRQASDTSVTVLYQKKQCGGRDFEDFWPGEVDEVLERNTTLDFVVVSLKAPPQGKMYPPPLQPLYKDIKLNDVVAIPQHPAETIAYKQGGYYYDIANKKRCSITPTAAINAGRGEVDAKCGALHGTSGSPLLDGSDTQDNTPYAIGLIVGCRLERGRICKPLSAAGFKMSKICDFDAGNDGKKLLDCKQP
jgi:hypothetical protein